MSVGNRSRRARAPGFDRRQFLSYSGAAVGTTALGLWGCGEDPDSRERTSSGPNAEVCIETASDILGPKYRAGAPDRIDTLADVGEAGERLFLNGTVFDQACDSPIANAVIDVWQANDAGLYDDLGYNLRGKFASDSAGRFNIETVLPGFYAGRPRHIHFIVTIPGKELTTQLYFAGDPFLAPNDPCGACASDEPSIVTQLVQEAGAKRGAFDIVLV